MFTGCILPIALMGNLVMDSLDAQYIIALGKIATIAKRADLLSLINSSKESAHSKAMP